MAQKKQTKKIKVRDLKPRKDAKGGFRAPAYSHPQQTRVGSAVRTSTANR